MLHIILSSFQSCIFIIVFEPHSVCIVFVLCLIPFASRIYFHFCKRFIVTTNYVQHLSEF